MNKGDEVLQSSRRGWGIIWEITKVLKNGDVKVKRYIEKEKLAKTRRTEEYIQKHATITPEKPSFILDCCPSWETHEKGITRKVTKVLKKGDYEIFNPANSEEILLNTMCLGFLSATLK